MKIVRTLVLMSAALLVVGGLRADDKAKCDKCADGAKHASAGMDGAFKALNLTDDQKTKIADLRKEYAPKIQHEKGTKPTDDQMAAYKELHTKIMDVLTADQKTQLEKARAAHGHHGPKHDDSKS